MLFRSTFSVTDTVPSQGITFKNAFNLGLMAGGGSPGDPWGIPGGFPPPPLPEKMQSPAPGSIPPRGTGEIYTRKNGIFEKNRLLFFVFQFEKHR